MLPALVLMPVLAAAGCTSAAWPSLAVPKLSLPRSPWNRQAVEVDALAAGQDTNTPLDRLAGTSGDTEKPPEDLGSESASWFGRARQTFAGEWGRVEQLVRRDSDRSALRSVESLKPKERADLHVAAAAVYESQNKDEQAIEQYRLALEEDPKSKEALVARARLHHRRNMLGLAVDDYETALEFYPDDPLVLNDLALCYSRQGRMDDAKRLLEKAIAVRPDEIRYRNNLAAILVRQHLEDQAVATLEPVMGKAAAHYNVGHFLVAQGERRAALFQFQRAATLNPAMDEAKQMVRAVQSQLSETR